MRLTELGRHMGQAMQGQAMRPASEQSDVYRDVDSEIPPSNPKFAILLVGMAIIAFGSFASGMFLVYVAGRGNAASPIFFNTIFWIIIAICLLSYCTS